jgi:raffinose/stachyose/melibiose transport system permease protein
MVAARNQGAGGGHEQTIGQTLSERAPRGSRLPILLSVLPGLALFGTFFVTAFGALIATAFTNWSLAGTQYVGFDNFRSMFHDDQFWMALRNTGVFVLAANIIQIPLATVVALILGHGIRGWRVMRVLVFLPNMMSPAAIALVYTFVLNPRFGLLNAALGHVGLDQLRHDWLSDVDTALWSVIGTWVFSVGLFALLILNEIQGLPPEVLEAAQLDGASRRQRAWHITVPLIRPVLATCMLLASLAALAYFEGVYVMTGGGPADHTMTLGLYSYLAYSRGEWGYANAVGLFMLGVGAAVILLIRRLGRTEESDR